MSEESWTLPVRPYRSRKHETAKRLLAERYGPSALYFGDRAWCYAKLAELGYRWDSVAGMWVAGKSAIYRRYISDIAWPK